MFAVGRILRNNKQLVNYICTSSVLKRDTVKKTDLHSKERETEEKSEDDSKHDILFNLRPPEKDKKEKKISQALVFAAENVAKDLGGDGERTKKDLLEYVSTMEVTECRTPVEKLMLEEEYVQHTGASGKYTKPDKAQLGLLSLELRNRHDNKEQESDEHKKRFNLPNSFPDTEELKLNIWDKLKAEELKMISKHPPENYYQEQINWTNEGRLWRFPIDNDQGLEREAMTSFTEHIFLEKHLEPWCPERGPLRKFMRMVLIGLSKNPYLSVGEKKKHIFWFRDYFEEKKKILQELGAMGPTKLEAPNEK